MKTLPNTRSCFVCGQHNPHGLRLLMETDSRIVRSRFVPRPEHAGFKEVVHGGLLSTILDEVMVWACAVQSRQFAYCAELSVRFVQPARPGQPFIATAELVSNRRNRLFEAAGKIETEQGTLLASATGKYLPVPPDQIGSFLEDFQEDPTPFLRSLQS